MKKHALAPVPHPDEPRKRRPKLETRAAEARLFRFFRESFREIAEGTTWRRRQQLREDAKREVNAYFDAKVGKQ